MPPRGWIPHPWWWPIAWLLLGVAGCANPRIIRDAPLNNPPPFSASGQVEMPSRWWTEFGDPVLNYQVNRALDGNFTLSAALQRLRASRALAQREASDLFLHVDGFANTDHTFGPGPDQSSFAMGLDAAYQVDLWGQIESRAAAEFLRAEATHADYHAVALTLAAEVARTWFALTEAHAQLALLDQQVETNRKGLTSQELRFGFGFVRMADVLRQRQLVEATLEQVVVVQTRIEVLEHQLALLLGELPQLASYDPGIQLPGLPPLPHTGLPSELLMRRPDVRSSYLAFRAADRDLAAAVSAQYPRINLTGSLVNFAERPETLFRDWFVSIGGQLIAPLMDGGLRRSEVNRTAAVLNLRFDEYGQTMLNALREVEDGLARERYQIARLERIDAQASLAQQASQQLFEQYLIGDADYLDVLSAVQAYQRLQREALSARLDLVLIRIGLYLALAGDFNPWPDAGLDVMALPADGSPGVPEIPAAQRQPLPPPVEFAPEIDIDD